MARTKLLLMTLALPCIAAISLSCRTVQPDRAVPGAHPLPQGVGRVAAMEAAKLVHEIISQCEDFPVPWIPWAADISVRGAAGSYRIDRQLKVGMWPNGSLMRIESVPQNTPNSFVLLVSGGSTTLLVDNGSRVVSSKRSAPLLARVIGVPFEERQLEAFLRGCYPTEFGGIPTLYGTEQLLLPFGANGRAYYQREMGTGPWRLQTLFHPTAGLEPAWRVDLFDLQGGRPRRFVVGGIATKSLRVDIRLSNVVAASLPREMFETKIPSTTRPISLDDINVGRLLAP